jgi:hypothetical protein
MGLGQRRSRGSRTLNFSHLQKQRLIIFGTNQGSVNART